MGTSQHPRRRSDNAVTVFWISMVVLGLLLGVIGFLAARMWSNQSTTEASPVRTAIPAPNPVSPLPDAPTMDAPVAPGTTPAASSQPAASDATPAAPTSPAGSTAPARTGKQTFAYFSVEVLGGRPDKQIKNRLGIEVRTCVVKLPSSTDKVEIGPAAWKLRVGSAEPMTALKNSPFQPPYRSGEFALGECNQGFIAFDTSKLPATDLIVLEYSNSFGDGALWDLSG